MYWPSKVLYCPTGVPGACTDLPTFRQAAPPQAIVRRFDAANDCADARLARALLGV
jgi:hypothetical protein